VEPVSILDEDFQKQVGKRRRAKTKAAEVEHASRHHHDVELDDDLDLQKILPVPEFDRLPGLMAKGKWPGPG
jgi:hypothetical protein